MDDKKIRDSNGKYTKKDLYLIENCRKCMFIDNGCLGILAIKGATIALCPIRQNLKIKEKSVGGKIKK